MTDLNFNRNFRSKRRFLCKMKGEVTSEGLQGGWYWKSCNQSAVIFSQSYEAVAGKVYISFLQVYSAYRFEFEIIELAGDHDGLQLTFDRSTI